MVRDPMVEVLKAVSIEFLDVGVASDLAYMLMTFFRFPFLIKGNKAAMTLFTPTTLVFKCSVKSFLFGHQSGEDHALRGG